MKEPSLADDVQFLKGVGPKPAAAFAKMGVMIATDLLFHLPRRYEDRRHIPPIGSLCPGQWTTVRGRIRHVDARPTRGGRVLLKAVLADRTGSISLTWFNQPWVRAQLEACHGDIVAYGQVKEAGYALEISSPEWEPISDDSEGEQFARIVPVYPAVEGLNQRTIRRAIESVLSTHLSLVKDPLPAWLTKKVGLDGLQSSIAQIHFPDDDPARLRARKRIVFDEFFLAQLTFAQRRAQAQGETGIAFPLDELIQGSSNAAASAKVDGLFERDAPTIRSHEPLWTQIHRMLPFELTGAQRRTVEEIWKDMAAPHPMNRLVQGDVGSGKTAVAACALVAAVRSGFQSALMAPTEILAEQHSVTLAALLTPLGIEVQLVVGKQTARERAKAMKRVQEGTAEVVVGTHALIQDQIEFRRLGLVIVDEQHRFGVLQRKALRDKSQLNPDVLVMTATPIPRTLTMAIYGDLDLSVIDELPPGRRPIKTHWKLPADRDAVYANVRKLVEEGRQCFFVCPLVGESEKMMSQAAEDLHYRLEQGALQGMRLGLLHGQMKPRDKEDVMERFRRHELDVLISTTVIEVGVDVPNASIMVIEDANRFGLSQLHQLRGRVGRGEQQSYCILIGDGGGEDAKARLDVMVSTCDGFKIAEEDWRLRGPGVVAGTQQSGNAGFRVADLVQDAKVLEIARQAAIDVVKQDPELASPQWSQINVAMQERRESLGVLSVS